MRTKSIKVRGSEGFDITITFIMDNNSKVIGVTGKIPEETASGLELFKNLEFSIDKKEGLGCLEMNFHHCETSIMDIRVLLKPVTVAFKQWTGHQWDFGPHYNRDIWACLDGVQIMGGFPKIETDWHLE